MIMYQNNKQFKIIFAYILIIMLFNKHYEVT
jgi:hypothetical protein